jgi:hypothetical protein
MANNIQVAEWFENLVDEGYLANSKTNILASGQITPVGEGYGKFKVMKVTTDGIGTYDKAAGYAESATTVSYEEITPDVDLSTSITIDHFDNEETMKKALVYGYRNVQDKLVREVDAIRIASIAKQAENVTNGTFATGDEVVAALRTAINAMDNKRVYNDKILFATPAVIGALEDMDAYKSKQILSNFTDIVKMEQDIFYTGVKVGTGKEGDWNYTKAEDAKDINFMIVSKSAVDCSAKARTKFVSADINQTLDADSMKLRFYALSAYVFENKKDGIYVNHA